MKLVQNVLKGTFCAISILIGYVRYSRICHDTIGFVMICADKLYYCTTNWPLPRPVGYLRINGDFWGCIGWVGKIGI